MLDNDKKGSRIVIMLIAIAFVMGALFGMAISEVYYMKQAIKNGHAQYNIETGDWEWKDVNKEEPSK